MNRRELMQGIVTSAIAAAAVAAGQKSTIAGAHPRLYLTPPTLVHLQQRFHTDKAWKDQLLQDGDAMLAEEFVPETVAEERGGAQANYAKPAHQIASMSVTLSLLYRLTKDERYPTKLAAALQHYSAYKRWGGQGMVDRDPSWHSELDTAQFCFGFANAVDALGSFLSSSQRQQAREAMVRLGIEPTLNDWITPGKRFHSFDSMGHNWWGVCVAGAGVAALSLVGEDHRAERWISQIDYGFLQWFTYGGNELHNRIETFDDGPSYEGVGYTGYGVTSYLRYLLAWRNVFPLREPSTLQYLRGLPEFFVHACYPSGNGTLPVNFEDCHVHTTSGGCILLLHACGVEDAYSRAYLSFTQGQMEDPLYEYVPWTPEASLSSLPLSKAYPKMGWAMSRTSWQQDATLLAVKCGYTWNHAHADASTFLLFHKGQPLVIDSGTCNYARPEYSKYYRQSIAHNVVLFDGKGQPVDQINRGTKFRGSILHAFDGVGLRFIGADATGPNAEQVTRHYRHFLWFGDMLLILDDIAAESDVQLDWLLHTAGTATIESSSVLHLQNGSAQAKVSMLYPTGVSLEEREGLAPERPDEKMPFHAFVFRTRDRRQRVVTALDLNPSSAAEIAVQEFPRYLAITVRTAAEEHRIYFNFRSIDGAYDMSSTVPMGEWLTDAYLFATTSPIGKETDVRRFFVMDGSFLRRNGASVLESLSKASCLWNQEDHAEVFTQGQTNLQVSLTSPKKPSTLRWNGKATPIDYDSTTRLIDLKTFSVS